MPIFVDCHLPIIPREVLQQMINEDLAGLVGPDGVRPIGHWVGNALHCVLEPADLDAIRQYHHDRQLTCSEFRTLDLTSPQLVSSRMRLIRACIREFW